MQIIFSDEASFHSSHWVNRPHIRYQSTTNLRRVYQQPLHNDTVTLWCVICADCAIGSYFCKHFNDAFVSVITDIYLDMLKYFFEADTNDREDGHFVSTRRRHHSPYSKQSLELLQEMYPRCLIPLRGSVFLVLLI